MKKNLRVKLLCLTLCSAALVFTGISCTANQNGDTPPPSESENVNKHSIEPVYDEETGVVSWRAVEGATKYAVIVNLRHQNGITAAYETTGLSQQLSLKQGISLITVVAYKDGTEVGNGVVTVELALDFEHPGTPTEIVYDKENGVLSWREAEKAAKYKITVSGVTDKSFALEKETARNSETLSLAGGVYTISVVAVNAQGAAGAAAEIEYASYVAAEFDTDENNDGVIDLFKFNDISATEIVYSGEYAEWASAALSTATAKIVDRTTLSDFTAETTDGALEILAPEHDKGAMSGITICLPKAVSVGVLRFDLNRQTGATTGIMLSDGKGHTAYYGGLGDKVAWTCWETVSVDITEFLKNNPDLECVREIGIYLRSTKGGAHYIDNLCYETLGNVGDISYDAEKKTLSWDKVYGATEYVVKQDGTELYRGAETSVILSEALDKDDAITCTVTLEAIGGEASKSKDYTLNFFGEIGAISMDKDTMLVYWDAVEGATGYTLYLNDEEAYNGTENRYQVEQGGEIIKDWVAKLVVHRGEAEKEKTAFVLCLHGEEQSFKESVAGSENECYIAEWHNLAAWGQFDSNGYSGGAENGVTLAANSWKVYTGGDMHTRIKQGYLHVYTVGGWADGAIKFILPAAINVSEIQSVSFKLKFTRNDGDGKARFYFNGTESSNYIDGGNSAYATIKEEGEWSVYTIDVSKISAMGITEINTIFVSGNNSYEMDIREVTYTKAVEKPAQTFGQLKTGTENEYYIAEWSNLAAWGQFDANGYSGGAENGVTLSTGSWKVYTGGDMHTRIKEGFLHIFSTGGWGDGRLTFNLPRALNVREIGSISFRIKFVASEGTTWSNDGKPRFYVNGTGVYIDGSKTENVTCVQDGEWAVYTISASVLSANGITDITDISVSSNNGYEMDIQEVTYIKAS